MPQMWAPAGFRLSSLRVKEERDGGGEEASAPSFCVFFLLFLGKSQPGGAAARLGPRVSAGGHAKSCPAPRPSWNVQVEAEAEGKQHIRGPELPRSPASWNKRSPNSPSIANARIHNIPGCLTESRLGVGGGTEQRAVAGSQNKSRLPFLLQGGSAGFARRPKAGSSRCSEEAPLRASSHPDTRRAVPLINAQSDETSDKQRAAPPRRPVPSTKTSLCSRFANGFRCSALLLCEDKGQKSQKWMHVFFCRLTREPKPPENDGERNEAPPFARLLGVYGSFSQVSGAEDNARVYWMGQDLQR
ncbi:hypothetical protein GN956_G8374 [Arapaima gigas]